MFARFEYRNRNSGAACAARAADAVYVGFKRRRNAEVDDVSDVFKINAAGCDVGCDDDFAVAGFRALHHAIAGILIKPPVQRLDGKPAGAQRFGHFVHFIAGTRKHNRKFRGLHVKNAP